MDEPETKRSFFAASKDPIWHSLALGAVGGGTCVLVGYPLDTIKVRLQSNQTRGLYRNLFRGIVPPLVAVVPAWVGVFVAYGTTLKFIGRDDMRAIAAAGVVAGCTYSTVVCPLELIKVNAQRYHLTTMDATRKVYTQFGLRGCYRGMGACLLRDTSQSVAYYVIAEMLNRSSWMQTTFGDWSPLFAGSITGVAHCLVEFPFDVIKTRYQTVTSVTYLNVVKDITTNVKERATVLRAMPPMLLRAVIAHGCSFVAVTWMKTTFFDPPSSSRY
eukprot:m.110527 g.110527  ORF g.110527 m.110527 type:complete len:272 (-) comp28049_c0_seq3:557-1372(-)